MAVCPHEAKGKHQRVLRGNLVLFYINLYESLSLKCKCSIKLKSYVNLVHILSLHIWVVPVYSGYLLIALVSCQFKYRWKGEWLLSTIPTSCTWHAKSSPGQCFPNIYQKAPNNRKSGKLPSQQTWNLFYLKNSDDFCIAISSTLNACPRLLAWLSPHHPA